MIDASSEYGRTISHTFLLTHNSPLLDKMQGVWQNMQIYDKKSGLHPLRGRDAICGVKG